MIDTIVFRVNVALSYFLHRENKPQKAKIITKAITGKTNKIIALMKNVGVLLVISFTPALSKKQSSENAASAD